MATNRLARTGVFQTKHELEVRRVLGWLRSRNIAAEFTYKDGWYTVILPTQRSSACSTVNWALPIT